jgi:holo-[acyl-carrier protein] synthase
MSRAGSEDNLEDSPNSGRVVGHGIDVVDLSDFSQMIREPVAAHLSRIFTPDELAAAGTGEGRLQKLASRFAIKEAVLKALGVGWGDGVAFTDVAVSSMPSGAPTVALHRELAKLQIDRNIAAWMVTASHTSSVAFASAIAVT